MTRTDGGVDAIVVGSGPNGLAAAVTLASAGLSVRVYEAGREPGGAARTAPLTLPGFAHDVGSAVHPMALASEFFRWVRITERIEFVVPDVSYGHALSPDRAVLAHRDLAETAAGLGADGRAWRALFAPLVDHVDALSAATSGSMLRLPPAPATLVRFGLRALEQGGPLWNARWRGEAAPALLTGVIAHTVRPLPAIGAAAAGLLLATHAHARGWPIPVGGTGAITDALVRLLVDAGGELVTDHRIRALDELPPARAVLLDTSAPAAADIAGARLPARFAARLRRFRFGNGIAKVDLALSDPVPWRAEELRRAGTVHVGGTRAELAASEGEVARGRVPENPYLLVSQPTLFDPSRAPDRRHTLWAYTHVPQGSEDDRLEAVLTQLERHAPGVRDTVLGVSSWSAADVERVDPNLVGGDIAAGEVSTVRLIARPRLSPTPWATPMRGLYLCSAATSPGPGVHGMGGFSAARLALAREFGIRDLPDAPPIHNPSLATPTVFHGNG